MNKNEMSAIQNKAIREFGSNPCLDPIAEKSFNHLFYASVYGEPLYVLREQEEDPEEDPKE